MGKIEAFDDALEKKMGRNPKEIISSRVNIWIKLMWLKIGQDMSWLADQKRQNVAVYLCKKESSTHSMDGGECRRRI